MTDIVSSETRSRIMSGIRSVDTKPELVMRRGLHRRGFRFRLHDRKIPGCPDLVFAGRRSVVFVNGCFWHGHECHLFRWPKSNEAFWRDKITANVERDRLNRTRLLEQGWRICRVWECALKGKRRLPANMVIDRCVAWLNGVEPELDIRGK